MKFEPWLISDCSNCYFCIWASIIPWELDKLHLLMIMWSYLKAPDLLLNRRWGKIVLLPRYPLDISVLFNHTTFIPPVVTFNSRQFCWETISSLFFWFLALSEETKPLISMVQCRDYTCPPISPFSSPAFEIQNFTNGFRLSQDQYIPCTSWENNLLLICQTR